MKPQEAIETIKIALAEVEWEYPMDYAAAFETAIEALEKQVPKKPIESKYGEQISCPHCSAPLIYCLHSYKGGYCEECGQAIDWSDADAD